MIKLQQVKYCSNPKEFKPDANIILRFVTIYQTEIKEGEVQTAYGVVILPQMYTGDKLSHGDKIQVLARKLQDERYQGEIKKISQKFYWRFLHYHSIMAKSQSGQLQRTYKIPQKSYFNDQSCP